MYDKVDVRMTSREVSWVIAGLTRPGVEKKWLFDETPKKKQEEKFHQKNFLTLACPWEKRGNRCEVKSVIRSGPRKKKDKDFLVTAVDIVFSVRFSV